jgi:hypothetical protein
MVPDLELAEMIKEFYINKPNEYFTAFYGPVDTTTLLFKNVDRILATINSLKCMPWYRPGIGFCNKSTLVLAERLFPKVDRACTLKTHKITIAGHSLGGSVALLIARMLELRGYEIVKVITFGAPRCVLKWSIKRFKNLPITQHIHDNDPMINYPKCSFLPYKSIYEWEYGAQIGFDGFPIEHYIHTMKNREIENR